MISTPEAERRWDAFARSNPLYYTHPGYEEDAYYESGRSDVASYLERFASGVKRSAALEVGSGMGRLTMPLAHEFTSVVGVDISPEYLKKLNENCNARGISNVVTKLSGGDWAGPERYDLILSIYSLQHVTKWADLVAYIGGMCHSLRPGGIIVAQFDTRPRTMVSGCAVWRRVSCYQRRCDRGSVVSAAIATRLSRNSQSGDFGW